VRIIDVRQRSEEWEALRARPTASEFSKFITPVRGDYSAKAKDYARTIVSKRLGVHVEAPPSYWMEWGVDNEGPAIEAYTAQTGRAVTEAGFVLPDHTDAYGCSPDGLVAPDGMLQVKCPKPETLMRWRDEGILPPEHRPQVQGELWITGLAFSDFWVWHPYMKPFLLRVEPDLQYQVRIEDCINKLLAEIERIESIERGENT
jgi:hypothetical protein